MTIKLAIQILIGVTGYCAWGIMAYFDPAARPAFLNFNIGMAVGTIGLALREMQTSAPAGTTSTKQGGRASPLLLAVIALAGLVGLAGCSSLQFAGTADYSIKPFVVDAKAGTAVCCEVVIHNGKEMASVEAHVVKDGDKITVDLKEVGVVAFKGQAIAAGSLQGGVGAAAKVAEAAALAPVMAAAGSAAGALATSGRAGTLVGGAALGVAADKALAPPAQTQSEGKQP